MTIAAAPDPMVSEAKVSLNFLRVISGSARSCRMVVSTSGFPFSPATSRPLLTWPNSIMLPSVTMPLSIPRQALEMSKTAAFGATPNRACTRAAVAGSRKSRDTEQFRMHSIWLPGIPARARAYLPAMVAASLGFVPFSQKRRSRMPLMSSRRP